MIRLLPINPSSSPITAKIESVEILGRNLYFCSELAKPLPIGPPEVKARVI
jgi:hypothetical protein